MTSEETKRKIGAANKITAKRYWDSLTESQKIKTGSAKTWFQKGQVSHNKGKKATLETRKKQSHSATLRFQTQKHPHEGTHRSDATKKLLREARLRQDPMNFRETVGEKIMKQILKNLGIKFEKQKSMRSDPVCITDFYVNPKMCIFVDGDYWHCNPNDYVRKKKLCPGFKPNDQISGKKYAKDKWARDKKITYVLRKKGYRVIRFWESELENYREKCIQKLCKLILDSS